MAGRDRIRVVRTSNGYERPVVVGRIDGAMADRIHDICPGTRVDGLPESEITPETKTDNVWGPWLRMARAWAGDAAVRHEGSTGGVLTALAQFMLADGRVDFVLHAKASAENPTFGEPHLSFTAGDVLEGAGSRYGPTAPLVGIDGVLDRGMPFAFVGKPCDIAALRNYARHDGRVDELVRYWLTPVCGGFMPPASMDAFLGGIGIEPDGVTAFRYRGRGCPGPTRIETAAEAREVHYLDLWGEDASAWQLPFRCKICPDGIGEAADIAASDTWPGGSPDREGSETDPGTNGVVVRTRAGLELLEAAAAAGAVVVERDITPDDMSIYQPHQMRKKYAAHDRHLGLGDEGRIVPRTERLRLAELAAEMPESHREAQRGGARTRVGDGRATEPTPQGIGNRE